MNLQSIDPSSAQQCRDSIRTLISTQTDRLYAESDSAVQLMRQVGVEEICLKTYNGWMKSCWLKQLQIRSQVWARKLNIVRRFPKLSLSRRHVIQERWKKVLYLQHAISVLTQWQMHEMQSTTCPAFPPLTMHWVRETIWSETWRDGGNLEYPCIKETIILKWILKN